MQNSSSYVYCIWIIIADRSSFVDLAQLHKARWMAKILYAVKMVLLELQIQSLPKGIIATADQQQKLRIFVNFLCLIYSRWWITCTSAVDAPWHDICLYQETQKYTPVNPDIAASALKAFKRHLWYLCPEMMPLALFSDIVPILNARS